MPTVPPRITELAEISDRYDGYLVDQWGVLHDGINVFPAALQALATLKQAGKRIVILSNSGRLGDENGRLMHDMGISPDLYDHVLSAGDDALDALTGARDAEYQDLGRRVRVFARPDDRVPLLEQGYQAVSSVLDADFLFVLSMPNLPQIPDNWFEELVKARVRNIPLICANPDVVRVNGAGEILAAPGALAVHYERIGGNSYFHGKPWPRIYRTALRLLDLPADRVIAIGDSLAHDIRGARTAKIDSLFVSDGIHRNKIDPDEVETLAAEIDRHAPDRPTYVIQALR